MKSGSWFLAVFRRVENVLSGIARRTVLHWCLLHLASDLKHFMDFGGDSDIGVQIFVHTLFWDYYAKKDDSGIKL